MANGKRMTTEGRLGLERTMAGGNILRHVETGTMIRQDRAIGGKRGYRARLRSGEVVHDTLGRVVARIVG